MQRLGGLITKAASTHRQVLAVASTEAVDRHGDVVRAGGLDTEAYRANPVVLLQHDHRKPVGKAIRVEALPKRIEALIQFADEGTDPDADRAYSLVTQGILNGISIGFRGLKSEPRGNAGLIFMKAELLEISIVAVPANADARIVARALEMSDARARARAFLELARMRH